MMESELKPEEKYFIDKSPSCERKSKFKRELKETDKSFEPYSKKRRFNSDDGFKNQSYKQKGKSSSDDTDDLGIKGAIVYFQNILKELKIGVNPAMKGDIICNILQESVGKEVELSCHSLASHCLEILLDGCEDKSFIQHFMSAFEKNKIPVCTSANASHLTELLMHLAVKALQNWPALLDASEESEEKSFVTYCINWLHAFGDFALENWDDCLQSQYSCHVVCTLIEALSGDLTGNKDLMSKNLKNHKREFHSQFSEINSAKNNQQNIVLEQIPKEFSDMLKSFYKALIKSENLPNYITDSSSATVIQALLSALRKRLPKACKKMIKKIAKKMFLERNQDNVPLALLHKNASYVFDEMFKAADEDSQLHLWDEYLVNNLEKIVIHSVGNFVIQRIFDAIKSKTLFEAVCKQTWCLFDKIADCQNFGIFVSMTSACNRLNAQQALFMENIMKCLRCFDPVERQDLVIPLLLGFQKYDRFMAEKKSGADFKICLQGSLVAQAILKFQKPFKAVKSIQGMSPEEIEFLAGHIQGCHVLNAFFGSITVGEKNKEKLLHHLQPAFLSMACDRNKSLTLSRIWTSLSLKSKEIIARQLALSQDDLKGTKSGYAVCQKFGIPRFKKLQEWRQMQSDISCSKKSQKH